MNTICTSGVVSIYKKEAQDEKIRLDGAINTYIMYLPDGTDDTVRGLNTSIDFSENINVQDCKEGMNVVANVNVKSIEARVINGRKIGIKATVEVNLKVYLNEEVEIINDIQNENDVQILKQDLRVNSLIGQGTTKINAKDNIKIDAMDNLAEILKVQICLEDRDIKVSYNKVLTKSEASIKIMYLTEDIEVEVMCYVYEEKQINLIQDMYSPTQKLNIEKKQILTMNDKNNVTNIKQIREKINLKDIDDLSLVDVDVIPAILNESKINTKILYEAELNLKFIFQNSRTQIITKEAKIPFDYTIDNLEGGESLNTNSNIEIKSKDFIIQDGGDINCNIDAQTETSMYRIANINMIDNIEEGGEREEQDYSIVIYIVKKGDTLWEIAKEFGSTVDGIARVNGIENRDLIIQGQKLYIPKFERIMEKNYE